MVILKGGTMHDVHVVSQVESILLTIGYVIMETAPRFTKNNHSMLFFFCKESGFCLNSEHKEENK